MRVLIVDDHEMLRRGVRSLLAAREDIEICGEAVDGHDAIAKAKELKPDVITMDISMPKLNGLEATREIHRILPDVQVLALSQYDLPEMMSQALHAGASGYVVKSAIGTELIAAIEKIRGGGTVVTAPVPPVPREHMDVREILKRNADFEKALQESQRRLIELLGYNEAVLYNMAEGLYTVDANGLLTSINPSAEAMLGWAKAELLGKKMHDVTHYKYPNGRPFPASECPGLQVLAKGVELREHEDVFISKDGNLLPVVLSASPLKINGSISGVVVSFRKDTLKRNADKRFRAIVETAPECIEVVAPDGTLLYMNSAGRKMMGAPSEEPVVGKKMDDLIAPYDRERFRAFHERVCRGQADSLEFDIVGIHGLTRHVESHATPFRRPDGMVAQLAITHDVTGRKQAEEAQNRLAAIVENSDDAIISKDLNGLITSWNAAAERMFGFTAQEAVGQPITIIVPDELRAEENRILSRLRAGELIYHHETVRRSKDGSRLHVSLTISPVRDSQGRVIGASKIARDITERKRKEHQLKEAEFSGRLLQLQDEERRRIARELHDGVGQLLAALSMNVSTLALESPDPSAAAAKCIEENASLVEQLSKEIRTMSYLLHPPLLDEVGLKSALEEYAKGFEQRSKIRVTLELAELLPDRLSQSSELSLFRIVQECLTNIHLHSSSPTALVRLTPSADQITLEVEDQGRGISSEQQAELLGGRNSGVGLRGMRERVRQLGGSLHIHSLGGGTTVRVVLPLHQREGHAAADRRPRAPSAAGAAATD